jgi:protein-S-isoprenylcysteine O-methyltransferase Ste14
MIDAFDMVQLIVLLVYLGMLIGRTLYLRLVCGIRPFTLGAGKSGIPALLERILFPLLVLWWVEILLYALNSPFRLFPPPLDAVLLEGIVWDLAGAALLLCACVLFAGALVSFGASWRVGIDTQHPGSLVTGGLFSLSRNSIFLSIDLYFLGTFLLNGTLVFLMAAVLAVAGMHFQILQEEEYLQQLNPEAYRTYCRKTGRYFGRKVWERQPAPGRISEPADNGRTP